MIFPRDLIENPVEIFPRIHTRISPMPRPGAPLSNSPGIFQSCAPGTLPGICAGIFFKEIHRFF